MNKYVSSKERKCGICKTSFSPRGSNHRFCGDKSDPSSCAGKKRAVTKARWRKKHSEKARQYDKKRNDQKREMRERQLLATLKEKYEK